MNAQLRIRDFDEAGYDPFLMDALSFGTHDDPYPFYAEMRSQGAVHEGSFRTLMGLGDKIFGTRRTFTVVGHAEVAKALVDSETFSNKAYEENLGTSFGKTITAMDPPEHVPWRRIFQKIFLPQYVSKWGDTIVEPAVRELMAAFLPSGRADLVKQFTHLFPFHVIYRQLDLPAAVRDTFQRLAIGQSDYVRPEKAVEAGEKLGEYFRELVAMRRANPGDDLVSLLALTEVESEHLPEDVLVSFLRQLMNAAGDTTYRGTSVLLTALLAHPDQLEAVRADRALIPQAIEEALRWDGPVGVMLRMATRDVELGGVNIPAGSLINLLGAAANRDPAVWPDPDRFDIFRDRKPHFAFARGPHMCVGQHLARVEMTRALNAVLDTMADIRLDPDMPPPQLKGGFMRVPDHIHVRFTPA
ncbi:MULTISPECIES: cytochrome P450 [unclassified Sphingobium]|uniref:cytochrome P450 n=1 Tax=unclassified Sphingobium TaxID=2611147 RepID=UPI000D164C0E|nr:MULTISPECIES: cytochrome P450 [unclassified Sphingobium]MBG6119976.1 cytochrome P450 [Sphingobium sp. JAI105]PSO11857.1 cytochrome P450 [Sphingobium sp. AEW4]TWC99585.1 cytochrome P450 [Sphingobium sp. AEW010]TWD18978.1 cytochrome P450 [Sphingobium sp. AEW013]TWD21849.1 cytochrome P450 [Sphingobium sp. AEW001]